MNNKITVFCSMTCLLLLHGGRARWGGKNGNLSTAAMVLIFLFLHQVPEFCPHVVLILRFLYHIPFFPASCLVVHLTKKPFWRPHVPTCLCTALSNVFPLYMLSTIFSFCLPSYSNGVCSTFLHIIDHTAKFNTAPFSIKRISITSILINKEILKICGISFQTPCLYDLMHPELRLIAVIWNSWCTYLLPPVTC